jgi:hypothetical protein
MILNKSLSSCCSRHSFTRITLYLFHKFKGRSRRDSSNSCLRIGLICTTPIYGCTKSGCNTPLASLEDTYYKHTGNERYIKKSANLDATISHKKLVLYRSHRSDTLRTAWPWSTACGSYLYCWKGHSQCWVPSFSCLPPLSEGPIQPNRLWSYHPWLRNLKVAYRRVCTSGCMDSNPNMLFMVSRLSPQPCETCW